MATLLYDLDAFSLEPNFALQDDVPEDSAIRSRFPLHEPRDRAQHCRFSGAVRAHEADQLVFADGKRHAGEQHGLVVADREVADFKQGHGYPRVRFPAQFPNKLRSRADS